MGREMKTELDHHADDLQLLRETRGAPPAPQPRVEEVMARDFVSLPPWFSAAQAGAVLRQTGKSYALFGGPGAERLATLGELQAASPLKSAASCATPLGPAIAVDASLAEALTVMNKRQLDRSAVVLGRVLVGIVAREALIDRLPLVAGRAFRLAA
jgi:CBS domain-containing protein